jgi:hypothetical protein
MKPSQEKKKTRPYLSKGFNTGIDLALQLMGFIPGGATNSRAKFVRVIVMKTQGKSRYRLSIKKQICWTSMETQDFEK